jgi:hypothetical protein
MGWNDPYPTDPARNLIENIIKLAYLYLSRKESPAPWKYILSMSQTIYLTEISKIDKSNYKDMEGILTRLSYWHSNYYLKDYCIPGITNIPVTMALGYSYYYRDTIPILLSGEHLSIVDFGLAEFNDWLSGLYIYNDIEAQARIWGVSQATDLIVKEYIRFLITPKEIKPVKITIDNNLIMKNNKRLRHIIDGIRNDITYPIRTKECESCPYSKRCSW